MHIRKLSPIKILNPMKLSFYAAAAVMALSGLSNALHLGGHFEHTMASTYAQVDALPVFFDELALAQQGGPTLFPQAVLDERW